MVIGLLCLAQPAAGAEEVSDPPPPKRAASSLDSRKLDESIERTLHRPEFAWRQPRERDAKAEREAGKDDEPFLAKIGRRLENSVKAIGRWLEDGMKWLVGKLRFTPPAGPRSRAPAMSFLEDALIVLIGVLFAAVVWLLIRLYRDRRPIATVAAEAAATPPDLADENVHATELPEDGWIRLANELLARGELRLALRAFYLAGLAHLGERHLITLARFKSNRDYERELQRRGHALGGLPATFAEQVIDFERVWYGSHQPTQEILAAFSARFARLKGHA